MCVSCLENSVNELGQWTECRPNITTFSDILTETADPEKSGIAQGVNKCM